MLCKCKKPGTVKIIGRWNHCQLEDGGYKGFVVFRCMVCGEVNEFPADNFKLGPEEGTEETKKRLEEMITR
jgi:hypothetical protein